MMMEMNHYAASCSSSDDLTLSTTHHHHDHHTSTSLHSITSSSNKLVCNKEKDMKKTKKNELAPKITRPCTECGRKFWSWKALFGHMRCHPERHWRGINPPPNHHLRSSFTADEYDVAASLLMLANAPPPHECSSCNKVFATHQALGGHRASHKNVKGCFAITANLPEQQQQEEQEHNHKCTICLRVFSSGQALGGHMRCHNSTLPTNADPHPHTLNLDLRLGI